MTRWVIGLTLIFALAVALALVGLVSNGYVMLIVAQHRIELSFNLFALLLLVGYGVFHLIARALVFAISLPERARAERAASEKQRAQYALNRSIALSSQGLAAQAEKQALLASAQPALRAAALVLAGEAALSQQAFERAEQHFDAAKSSDESLEIARLLALAQSLIAREQFEPALVKIREVLSRDGSQPLALTLRQTAFTALKRWPDALLGLKEMRKAKVDSDANLFVQEIKLHGYALEEKRDEPTAISSYWHKLSAEAKRDVDLMLKVVDWLLAKGAKGEARAVLEEALPGRWDSRLAERYGDTAENDALSQIERAERWLLTNPRDPGLLISLGKLCFAQGLWGKAQSYVDASASLGVQLVTHQIAQPVIATKEHNHSQHLVQENANRIANAVQHLRAQLRERLVLSTLGT